MTRHLEDVFKNTPYDDILLKFERGLIGEWNETEARLRQTGLKDEQVIYDLFLSFHPDLPGEYEAFRKAEIKKRREKATHKFLLWGTPVWFLLMIGVYLGVSFLTGDWARSWLAIIFFVTFWVDLAGLLIVKELASKRRLFHPIARVILGLAVMMTAVFIYLHGLMLFHIPHFWVVIPAGVFFIYVADAVFARKTGQKLRILNYLVYIPAAAPMVYVVLAGARLIPWHPGWLIVPLSLIADVAIIVGKAIENGKYIYRPDGEDA